MRGRAKGKRRCETIGEEREVSVIGVSTMARITLNLECVFDYFTLIIM